MSCQGRFGGNGIFPHEIEAPMRFSPNSLLQPFYHIKFQVGYDYFSRHSLWEMSNGAILQREIHLESLFW